MAVQRGRRLDAPAAAATQSCNEDGRVVRLGCPRLRPLSWAGWRLALWRAAHGHGSALVEPRQPPHSNSFISRMPSWWTARAAGRWGGRRRAVKRSEALNERDELRRANGRSQRRGRPASVERHSVASGKREMEGPRAVRWLMITNSTR